MATTQLKLVTGDKVSVEMSAEDVNAALDKLGALARLPTGDGEYIYVNPVHIMLARDTTNDEGPMGGSAVW